MPPPLLGCRLEGPNYVHSHQKSWDFVLCSGCLALPALQPGVSHQAYLVACPPPSPAVPPGPGFPASPQMLIFIILKQIELCLF